MIFVHFMPITRTEIFILYEVQGWKISTSHEGQKLNLFTLYRVKRITFINFIGGTTLEIVQFILRTRSQFIHCTGRTRMEFIYFIYGHKDGIYSLYVRSQGWNLFTLYRVTKMESIHSL